MSHMKRLAILIPMLGSIVPSLAQFWAPCYYTLEFVYGYHQCDTYDDWILVFEDNFDGTTLDETVWHDSTAMRNRYCNEKEAQYYTTGENLNVSDGTLKIIAEDEQITALTVDWMEPDDELYCEGEGIGEYNEQTYDYKSGQILSKPKFVHGIFEIRCKIPSIELLWPAFWIYGGDCGQEIDVFEFLNESSNPTHASKQVVFTYHRHILCQDNQLLSCDDKQSTGTDMSQAMHTYSVEWDEHEINWRIDGDIVLTRSMYCDQGFGDERELCGNVTALYWYKDLIYLKNDIPMQIIANLAVKTNSEADFPVQMEIDYIRVYQRINSSTSVNICSNADILGSSVAGQEINVGGESCSSITIEDDEFLYLVAKDGISILSDFEADLGATLELKIDD